MALPENTSRLIEFLRPGVDPVSDYIVAESAGGITIEMYSGPGLEPTELELIAAETDVTLVDHGDGLENFSTWEAKNGGDPTLTRRKRVSDRVEESSELGVEQRAMIQLLNKRDNYLTNRIIELQNRVQAMLDSTGGVANMRSDGLAVPISATSTRPLADAKQDYRDDINAGTAD